MAPTKRATAVPAPTPAPAAKAAKKQKAVATKEAAVEVVEEAEASTATTKRAKKAGKAVAAPVAAAASAAAAAVEAVPTTTGKKSDALPSWEKAETIGALTKGIQAEYLWATVPAKEEMLVKIGKWLEKAEKVLPEPAADEMDADTSVVTVQQALEFYAVVVKKVQGYVDLPNALAGKPSAALFGIVQSFHDSLFKFENEVTSSLLPGMVSVCEAWFLAQAPEYEQIAPQTISYLLLQSLQESSKGIDTKRVYAMRSALTLLDFNDPSSQSIKNIILHAYIHPQYLTTVDGRRFLVYAMGLHPPMIGQIYSTIRNQIPNASKTTLDTLGDVIYRAWKSAEGVVLQKLEYDCIQDLMNHAVHASVSPLYGGMTMAARLRRILNVFHGNKTQPGVDEMLFRLYEPILWRALKVAHPTVRRNAGTILIDAFPLREPNAVQADIDEQMQRQFDTLADLLNDDSPQVRQVGVEGVCRVLAVFWELIPVVVIADFLKKLTEQLAFDASDVGVRASVPTGIKYILDNAPLSHASLKVAIQRLSPLMHDNAESVRVAMAELLLTIKAVPDIKFWDIVEIPRLLAQLSKEGSKVCKILVEVLLNSFFPVLKDVSVQLERANVLLAKNKAAARAFYFYLPRKVAAEATLPLAQAMYANAYDGLAGGVENSPENDTKGDHEGMLELTAILLDSIFLSTKKSEKKTAKQLATFFKDRPLDALNEDGVCSTQSSKSALFVLARHAPSNVVPLMAQQCLDSLVDKKAVKPLSSEVPGLVRSIDSWGQTNQVVGTVVAWLQQSPLGAFARPAASKQNGARKKSKAVATEEQQQPSDKIALNDAATALRALDVVDAIMGSADLRGKLLQNKDQIAQLEELLACSWKVLDVIVAQSLFDDSELLAFVQRALVTHAKLDIHQWAHQNFAAQKQHGKDGEPVVVTPPALADTVLDKLATGFTELLLNDGDAAADASAEPSASAEDAGKEKRGSRKRKPAARVNKKSAVVKLLVPLVDVAVEYCVLGAASLAQTLHCVAAIRALAPKVLEVDKTLMTNIKKIVVQATQQSVLAPSDVHVQALVNNLMEQVSGLVADLETMGHKDETLETYVKSVSAH